MPIRLADTIAAIASAPGGAARGIVRVSGDHAVQCVAACFRSENAIQCADVTRPSVLKGALTLPGFSSTMPCDLYLWPGRRSYTGSPVAELHTIGSPPLLDAVLQAVCEAGARLAEPGEFTLRAFLAGRLDLVQAEAVLGVIDAAGANQLKTALDQLAGGLSRPLAQLRDDLLNLLADLEAGLDFVEEDIELISAAEVHERLLQAADAVRQVSQQMCSRGQITNFVRVVLVGSPNVGKSSLFNALIGNGAALVSAVPGTTRDYLTAQLELGGISCELIDTAGATLVDDLDSIDRAAQDATRSQDRHTNVRVFCIASTRSTDPAESARLAARDYDLLVLTKCDHLALDFVQPGAIATSSATGAGLDLLRERLREAIIAATMPDGAVASTAARCSESLRFASESLQLASDLTKNSAGDELVASEIRSALTELGKVVGAIYTDDVLDRIFSRFCIGK